MLNYYFFIRVVLLFSLFKTIVTNRTCERKEDCSTQIEGLGCSFCVGENDHGKCIYPFPDRYTIEGTSSLCEFNRAVCKTSKPCENGGTCHDTPKGSYLCECKPNYVGERCEIKYDKIKFFHLKEIDFKDSVKKYDSTDVTVMITLPKHERLDEIQIVTKDSYYANVLLINKGDCNTFKCDRSYKGGLRYFYKPYNNGSKDFLLLNETVLGYFTKFEVVIIHKGSTIFKREIKIFVSYPEMNNCVPQTQLKGCSVDYNKPTVLELQSWVNIYTPLKIVSNGNSPSFPFNKKILKLKCKHDYKTIFRWVLIKLGTTKVIKSESMIRVFKFRPTTFGFYKIELDAKHLFSGMENQDLAACYFLVKSLPLEAIIEGGSNRSIAMSKGLLLSAKNSRDLNNYVLNKFIYTKWSCIALGESESDISKMCKPVIFNINHPYFIAATNLHEGDFNFTLEIWSTLYNNIFCRGCEMAKMHQFSYQIVKITNKTSPLILCQINCGNPVTVNKELILKVYYPRNTELISYKWTCMKIAGAEKVSLVIPDLYPSYIFQVPQGTLETASHYLVSVSSTLDGEDLSASYSFETDDFNYQGNCSINPEIGIRGITLFDIKCITVKEEAIIFEFYDKTSKEASENAYLSGRMLGTSHNGELDTIVLTRGILVVYIIHGCQHINKTYKVNLTDMKNKTDATLLHEVSHSSYYFQNMPHSLKIQYYSSIPDLITNQADKKAFLDVLIQNLIPGKIVSMADAKLNLLTLNNILSRLGKGNMDFRVVQSTRFMMLRMTEILEKKVLDNFMVTSQNEVKEIIAIILDCLELSLTNQNKREIDGTNKLIDIGSYLDFTLGSLQLEQILDNVMKVVSLMQQPGLPPMIISSFNNTFIFKVLKEDPKYNFLLSNMLHIYSDIPVKFPSVMMKRLQNSLNPEESLCFCVAIITENIFKWFDKTTVSNLLFISLNKINKDNNIINVREIVSPMDMELYINGSITEVKEVVQTTPLDLTLDEDSLDLQVEIHRFDPVPGSRLSVTFLYPPTNIMLKVLIMKHYRPTYKMMMSLSSLVTDQLPYYTQNYTITEPNTFYYMGVLPVQGITINKTVHYRYSFTVNSTTCVSWKRVKWSSAGCSVGPNTSGNRIHCQCNHLSIFGALFPFLHAKVDPFADVKLLLTVRDNPLVVSILVVTFVLYVILCVYAYQLDRRDRFRGTITVLEDNFSEDKHPYLLAVYTSFCFFAGTSANVGVQLIGELASSRVHILRSKYYKVLNRHSDNWFLILCPKPLGIIQYLHIWHDNTGFSPDWYCDKVHVYDINSCLECIFIVEQWIDLNLTSYPEALVLPASSEDVLKINRVLNNNISSSLNEQRSVARILTQHPRSIVRRIQIVNISMCSLLIALLFSIMFYTDPNEQKPDDYAYSLKTRDMYISFVTIVVILTVHFVLSVLFKKSYRCVLDKTQTLLYLRCSDFVEEYFVSKQQLKNSGVFINRSEDQKTYSKPKSFRTKLVEVANKIVKSQKLAPAVLPNGTSVIQVKKLWLTLTWVTCAIIIVLCMYLIILYGLKMDLVKSKEWLTSVLISYVENTVIVDSLKIVLLAVTLIASFDLMVPTSNYRATENEIRLSLSDIQSEVYESLIKKRQHTMYSPIPVEVRDKMLKKKLKCLHRIQVFRFILSICYIMVAMTIVHHIRSLNYFSNSHLKRMITYDGSCTSSISFHNTYDILELSDYLNQNFLKVIYNSRWYDMRPLLDNESSLYWTSDYSWRMVGAPYIRQLRVFPVSCHSFAPPSNRCIPQWGSQTEDTDPYGLGWVPPSSPDSTALLWSYTSPTESWVNTYYRLKGKSDIVYNSGGYKARIGSSIKETVETVTELFDHKWIDCFTKTVFVEMTLYNVNLHSFSQITLIVEYLTTSVSLETVKITSVVDCKGINLRHIAFIVLTLMFVLEICHKINYKGFAKVFKDMSNILLLAIVIPNIFITLVFFIHVYNCSVYSLRERYYDKQNDYFDFDRLIMLHNDISYILSLFLLIGVWRSLLLLQTQNLFPIIYNLFKLSLSISVFLLLLTAICFLVLWQIYLILDVSTNNRILSLVVLQKNSEYLSSESIVFAVVKFVTVVMTSNILISIFIYLNSIARHWKRGTKKSVLYNVVSKK